MTPEFLDATEVAARLRISAGTVRAWVKAGRMPGLTLGPKCVRVRPAELDAWLLQQHRGPVFSPPAPQPEQVADDRQAELPLEQDPVLQHVLDTREEVTP